MSVSMVELLLLGFMGAAAIAVMAAVLIVSLAARKRKRE